MNNFIEFIGESPSAAITINGHAVTVSRVRFGLHLRLSLVEEDIRQHAVQHNILGVVEGVRRYLVMSGLPPAEMDAPGEELLFAYYQIRTMNELKARPAVLAYAQHVSHGEGGTLSAADPPPYEYDGRYWAWMIATIADRYGWSEEQILDLYPESAFYYLQEALIMNYNDVEFAHQLSEVSYGYDKNTQKSTYHPIPKPAWMQVDGDKPPEEKKVRVRSSFLPMGTITRIDGTEHEYIS